MTETDPLAHLLRTGATHQQAGRIDEARAAYEQALTLDPRQIGALLMLSWIYIREGRIDEGLKLTVDGASYYPDDAMVQASLGETLAALGRLDEALVQVDRAVALDPALLPPQLVRAECLRKLDRPAEALAGYDLVLAMDRNNLSAISGRAMTLQALRRPAEAVAAYDAALALDPRHPTLHSNRANALFDLDRFKEALTAYDAALAAAPNAAEVWTNRGTVLLEFGRIDDAMASFRRAVQLQPDFLFGLMNLALGRLLLGDYRGGFERSAWRRRFAEGQAEARGFTQPLWFGEGDLTGRTLLVYDDQGAGDSLQFCRYLPRLTALGARVVFATQPELMRLFADLPGAAEVVLLEGELPPHDLQTPLSALPIALGDTLETLPAERGYLAAPDQDRRGWAERLGAARGKRIGIAWSGNPTHVTHHKRKLPLDELLAALPPGVETVCLQVGADAEASADKLKAAGVRRTDQELTDFADTAGLIANLDLVITGDTSVAHLAGALGKPVWLLTAYVPDWRWLLTRADSPWYPSMRLLRQERAADWSAPMGRLKADLKTWAAQ